MKLNRISQVDASYIAGLVDGEGTITLTRKHRNENRQLCLSISSTERPLLEFVLDVTGVGKITRKKTTSRKHAPSFTYAVYNRQALGLIELIAPALKSYKRKRAEIIQCHYLLLTPRNGYYTKELAAARKRFEKEVLGTTEKS